VLLAPVPSKNTGIYAVFTMLQDVLPTAQAVAKSCEIPKILKLAWGKAFVEVVAMRRLACV